MARGGGREKDSPRLIDKTGQRGNFGRHRAGGDFGAAGKPPGAGYTAHGRGHAHGDEAPPDPAFSSGPETRPKK